MCVNKNSNNVIDVKDSSETVSSVMDQHVLQVLKDHHSTIVARSRRHLLVTGTWSVRTLLQIETTG